MDNVATLARAWMPDGKRLSSGKISPVLHRLATVITLVQVRRQHDIRQRGYARQSVDA